MEESSDSKKILVHSLRRKLELIKQLVRTLEEDTDAVEYLQTLFSKLSPVKMWNLIKYWVFSKNLKNRKESLLRFQDVCGAKKQIIIKLLNNFLKYEMFFTFWKSLCLYSETLSELFRQNILKPEKRHQGRYNSAIIEGQIFGSRKRF